MKIRHAVSWFLLLDYLLEPVWPWPCSGKQRDAATSKSDASWPWAGLVSICCTSRSGFGTFKFIKEPVDLNRVKGKPSAGRPTACVGPRSADDTPGIIHQPKINEGRCSLCFQGQNIPLNNETMRPPKACINCNRRKQKCDLKKPCGRCSQLKTQCTYSRPGLTKSSPEGNSKTSTIMRIQEKEEKFRKTLISLGLLPAALEEKVEEISTSSHTECSNGDYEPEENGSVLKELILQRHSNIF